MQWQYLNSPSSKMFKMQPSAGKVMCTIFWDRKGAILLDLPEPRSTINCCITMPTKPGAQTSGVRPEKKMIFLLQHQPHTSLKTMEHTASLVWIILPHPPKAPSVFWLVKDGLYRWHFARNDAISYETVGYLCWCRFLRAEHADSCSLLATMHSQW